MPTTGAMNVAPTKDYNCKKVQRSTRVAMPVTMPRLGESVAEGTIGAWLKKEGDYVEKDESLAEIITDKINAELPSPVAGRLQKILVQSDQTVTVGTQIALIEESADVAAAASATAVAGVPG